MKKYTEPSIELVELEMEDVICTSGTDDNFTDFMNINE